MQNLFEKVQQMGHEQVVFCHDAHSGLNAIIAIHNTTLGPALGGTRVWNYNSHEDAIIDALRLSRGMTYKNAISGLNIGGGKAVIIADPKMKSEELWRRYGRFVNSLNGKYITAEDVNTNTADMEFVSLETKFVTGVPEYAGGSGDPSPFTAQGVFMGMKASAKKAYGNDSLVGKKVLVQGAGHVGQYLIGHLVAEGATVMVSDIDAAKLKAAVDKYPGIKVVDNASIFDLEMDIYAPCALGATLNDESIAKLKCAIVAGAANNQLADENVHGPMLVKKGIVYGPDFLINAGGVINVAAELDGYNLGKVNSAVERIYNRTLDIYALSEKENTHPQAAAMIMAQKRIDDMAAMKSRM
jgi:leucine dehydrogenase